MEDEFLLRRVMVVSVFIAIVGIALSQSTVPATVGHIGWALFMCGLLGIFWLAKW